MKEKLFYIKESDRNAILQYLLQRPMKEIEAGVTCLRNLKEFKIPEVVKEEDSVELPPSEVVRWIIG